MNNHLSEDERREVASFRPLGNRIAATVAMIAVTALVVLLFSLQFVSPMPRPIGTETTRIINGPFQVLPTVTYAARTTDLTYEQSLVTGQTVVVVAVGNSHRGSGFLMQTDTVITAAHIGGDEGCDYMVTCGGNEVAGTRVVADMMRDVAVIRTNGCEAEPLMLDESPLDVDDRVTVSGFGFSFYESRQFVLHTSPIPEAVISMTDLEKSRPENQNVARIIDAGTELHAIAGILNCGSSGSPVFRDDGSVIGMVSLGDVRRNRTFIVAAAEIETVLMAAGLN